MEDEFLRIRQFFPDRREKGRLFISQLDNQPAMFFFEESKQFRGIFEILLIGRGKDGNSDIEIIVFYLVHGQRIESRVLERSILGVGDDVVGEFGMRNDGAYTPSELSIHFQGNETRSFLSELLVIEFDLLWVAESELF